MSPPADNYDWWRLHAGTWKDEVSERRKRMPIYRLQELFLLDYFTRTAPARVLEFGCGFGRHLEYLSALQGLDVHGFDQSEQMVEQIEWAEADWIERKIRVGAPLDSLPYPDNSFDVTFTVSVLIHVRPEDLSELLGELLRVTRGHVLHIENPANLASGLTSKAHDGCWAHDLAAAYRVHGVALERLPQHFVLEDCYRAPLSDAAALPVVSELSASHSLALDREISDRLERDAKALLQLEREREHFEATVKRQRERIRFLSENREQLRERGKSAEKDREELLQRARAAESKQGELREELAGGRAIIDEQRERARRAEDRCIEIQERLGELREELAEGRAIIDEQRERARRAEDRCVEIQERLRSTIRHGDKLRTRAERAEADLVATRAQSRVLAENLVAARAEAQELAEAEAALEALRSRHEQAVTELGVQRRRLSEAEENLGAREAELGALRNALRPPAKDGRRGVQ